jgi:uncharacterized membrane protein YtjA (UPF0391 family)
VTSRCIDLSMNRLPLFNVVRARAVAVWNPCDLRGVAGRAGFPHTERAMLYWALMFLVVALVAGVFGFGGIASTATGMAQILFVIALVVFAIGLFAGFVRRNL